MVYASFNIPEAVHGSIIFRRKNYLGGNLQFVFVDIEDLDDSLLVRVPQKQTIRKKRIRLCFV